MLNNYDEVLTVDELCEILKIGRNTAYRLLDNREIKASRIGRVWKIPKESVKTYILTSAGIRV